MRLWDPSSASRRLLMASPASAGKLWEGRSSSRCCSLRSSRLPRPPSSCASRARAPRLPAQTACAPRSNLPPRCKSPGPWPSGAGDRAGHHSAYDGLERGLRHRTPSALRLTLDHLHWLTSGATSFARGMNGGTVTRGAKYGLGILAAAGLVAAFVFLPVNRWLLRLVEWILDVSRFPGESGVESTRR